MSASDEHREDHDLGLSHDLPTLLSRRRALGLAGAAGLAAALAACSSGSDATSGSTAAPARPTARSPRRPSGPYPADGTNGANVLTESGIVRSDIRSSFGDASAVAGGVPLTFSLTVVDVSGSDDAGKPAAGAAVYAWHCDREGRYSMYGDAVARRELPARRAGGRRRRQGHVHLDLPGLLLRALAAHPLRGLPDHRRRDLGVQPAADVAAGPARGRLP